MAREYFSKEAILPPIGGTFDTNETIEDLFPSSKLSNIEAQRVMSVLTELQKKIYIVNFIQESMDKRMPTILTGEGYSLITEYQEVEKRYRTAAEAGKFAEAKEIMKAFKSTTRALLRHFLNNMNSFTKLRSLKRTKPPILTHFEHRLQEYKNLFYYRLKTTVEEENSIQEQLSQIVVKEMKTNNEVKALKEELETAKKDRMGEINRKNDIIRRLKDELKEIKHQGEDAAKSLELRSKQKEEIEIQQFSEREREIQADIDRMELQLKEDINRNREDESNARKKKFKIECEVENWILKYDQDMEEKQVEIDELAVIYSEEKSHLEELQSRFKDLQKEYDAILDEKKRSEAAEKVLVFNAGTCPGIRANEPKCQENPGFVERL
jgi:DNA repair exonuclease SbcCD ATPase subunit